MSRRGLQSAAAALILLALALLAGGLQAELPLVWGSGLAAVGVAMFLSLLTRWASAPARPSGTRSGRPAAR